MRAPGFDLRALGGGGGGVIWGDFSEEASTTHPWGSLRGVGPFNHSPSWSASLRN